MTQDDMTLKTMPAPEGPARMLARTVLDFLLPHQCLACNDMVGEQWALCLTCWAKITFPSAPYCDICALPFEFDVGGGSICGVCSRQAPDFARARSAMVYDDASRRLVLGFKHGDRTEAASAFGRWMVRTGADLITNSDVIVPVLSRYCLGALALDPIIRPQVQSGRLVGARDWQIIRGRCRARSLGSP